MHTLGARANTSTSASFPSASSPRRMPRTSGSIQQLLLKLALGASVLEYDVDLARTEEPAADSRGRSEKKQQGCCYLLLQ